MPLFVKKKKSLYMRSHGAGKLQIKREGYHTQKRSWYETQDLVYKRDGHRCTECRITQAQSKAKYDGKMLQVHHIKPLSRGGRTVLKILSGEITKAVNLKGLKVSAGAKAAIEAAGGSVA